MTSGEPLYLVSACGSAEEFVAAFRRYADRTGLFIPSASPLPAGRRGYLAVTLKDGGVMIQGEAEILQSSAKPTVLHGRPGMTVKFIEPDELSKIVIGELEKARLAMKVPTPSVLPRPATIPAEPRPVVPPIAGRIDAANALAECVVIGDPATLIDTANAPRGVHDPASAGTKAKFVMPSIPSELGGRPKTPSVPPAISAPPSRPRTPSVPPSISAPPSRPKTPSVPPSIPAAPPRLKTPSIPPSIPATGASEPSGPKPAPVTAKPESSGPNPAPVVAKSESSGPKPAALAAAPPEPNASKPTPRPAPGGPSSMPAPGGPSSMSAPKMTSVGFPAIDKFPAKIDLLQTQHGVSGAAMRTPAAAMPAGHVETDEEATTLGEAPPKKITDPMPTTAPQKTTELAAAPPHAKSHKATSIGFPAMRSPFETQPVGVVPPPMPAKAGDPAPPLVAKSKSGVPGPRGKNPTTPPLTPRHPTPVAPLPIVRPPARSAMPAAEEEEKTDLGGVPQPADPHAPTVESGRAYNDGVDPHEKTAMAPHGRSGGMRASEIMAAIPTEDWTMTPEASQPTVLPSMSQPTPGVVREPASAGPAPKGPPTGDWTIQLDPEAGWSPPANVEKPAPADETKPAKRAKTPPAGAHAAKSGNPDVAVSSKEAFTAVEWEDKPTGIGEAKIEIDSTLMEPLTPMPALEDEDPAALMQPLGKMPSATGSQSAYSTGPQQATGYATGPHLAAPTRPEVIPPPLAPMPPVGTSSGFSAAALMTPHAMPAAHGPDSFGSYGQMPFPQQPAHDVGASRAIAVPSKKKRIVVMASVAAAAVLVVVLVMLLTAHKANKPAAGTGSGSALVDKPVIMPANGSAAVRSNDPVAVGSGSAEEAIGSGSAQQAIAPAVADAGAPTQETPPTPPTPSGTCQVQVDSVPSGADVFVDKNKLGATPDKFDLPCGVESTLTLRKAKFLATARAVTPVADKPNKVLIRLGKMTFSLKVTSTPAGATITAGGKNAGVTPATIKIPGFEATTVTLSKPGYTVDSQKVTAKANGQAHHVVLKKGGRH